MIVPDFQVLFSLASKADILLKKDSKTLRCFQALFSLAIKADKLLKKDSKTLRCFQVLFSLTTGDGYES